MLKLFRYLGQAVTYALFAVGLGYFANAPSYAPVPTDKALLKLSFVHTAKRRVECRQRTAQELAALAPNMRRNLDCPRERVPLNVEVELDGQRLCTSELRPTGLSHDGAAAMYRKFVIEPGPHHLVVRMRDSVRESGYDFELDQQIEVAPRQHVVVDFDQKKNALVLQ